MYIKQLLYPSDNALFIDFVNLHQMILDIFNEQTSLFYHSWSIEIDHKSIDVLDETYDGDYFILYLNSNIEAKDISFIWVTLNLTHRAKRWGHMLNVKANDIIQLTTMWRTVKSLDGLIVKLEFVGEKTFTPEGYSQALHDVLLPKWENDTAIAEITTEADFIHDFERDVIDVIYTEVNDNEEERLNSN